MPINQFRIRQGFRFKGGYTPQLGDIVEVYWVGEGKWFEGEVIDTNPKQYRVHYKSDSQKHWHDKSARVRVK